MIIVLEGVDLAGKSTLARYLTYSLRNPELLKQGVPPPDGDLLDHYLQPIADLCVAPMTNRPEHLILDRWHVGELIYGPLLRGKSRLTGQQADYIDMVMQTFGCAFLHVDASLQVLEQRYDIRGDDHIKEEQLFDIKYDYADWMRARPHWQRIEVSYDHLLFDELSSFWKAMRPSPMAGRYIGPAEPRVLLLGDRRGDNRLPFPFVPNRATSGHWLMGAMHEAGVNHMEVGIVNANELQPMALDELWFSLGQPPVIPLGNNARKAWEQANDTEPAGYLNHPQYERRFHYLKLERYGQAIKKVMK